MVVKAVHMPELWSNLVDIVLDKFRVGRPHVLKAATHA